MKIEYRLPSKNVQYGYVSVDGTAEELAIMDFQALGRDYIASVRHFWKGEELQVDVEIQREQVIDLPKNETARTNLARTPMREVETVALPEGDAEKLLVEELGAVKISEEVYDEPVNSEPKAWEAPSVFDFGN